MILPLPDLLRARGKLPFPSSFQRKELNYCHNFLSLNKFLFLFFFEIMSNSKMCTETSSAPAFPTLPTLSSLDRNRMAGFINHPQGLAAFERR